MEKEAKKKERERDRVCKKYTSSAYHLKHFVNLIAINTIVFNLLFLLSDFYPTIAILPAGAQNITITEITESSNNLCKLFYDGWWISLPLVILFL